MSSHPYYATCKSISDKELTPRDYINKQFKSFFVNLYGFLHQFQKQVKTKFFQKEPIKTLKFALDATNEIFKETKQADYKLEMADDMKLCFEALLHPLNSNEIRTYGVKFFITVVNALGSQVHKYIEGFQRLVIDYTPFIDSCDPGTNLKVDIKPELRIQINDSVPQTKANIISHLELICSAISMKDADAEVWWKVIQKIILEPMYRKVPIQFKQETSNFGVIGKCPLEVQKLIRELIIAIFTNMETAYTLISMYMAPQFIFAIMDEAVKYYLNEPMNFDMIELFFRIFADQKSKITVFLKEKFPDLLMQTVDLVLEMQTYTFSREMAPNLIKRSTAIFQTLIIGLQQIISKDKIIEMFTKIANWKSSKVAGGVSHVIFATLETIFQFKVVNTDIWKIFVNESYKDQRVFNTIAVFFAYIGFNFSPKLLSLNDAALKQACEEASKAHSFLRNSKMWIDKLSKCSLDNFDQIFRSNIKELTYPEIYKHCVNEKINLRKITPLWTIDDFLNLVRMIRDLYQERNEFIVYFSFIKVFVVLYQVIPYTATYNRNFIFAEFLDWLRDSLTNTEEINRIRSLELLDSILMLQFADTIVPDSALAEIYSNITNMISSSTKTVKQTAINLFIHLINKGLRYANNYTALTLSKIELCPELQPRDLCSFLSGCRVNTLYGKNGTNEVNSMLMYLCQCTENSLKVQVLMTILIEECVFNRKELITVIAQYIVETLVYRNIFDVLSFSQVVIIFPLLIKCDSNTALSILNQITSITEQKKNDGVVYLAFIKLLADLIISASHYINVESFVDRFIALSEKWDSEELGFQKEEVEKLKITKKLLAVYLNRDPPQSFESPKKAEKAIPFWSEDSIIDVTPKEVTVNSCIGNFKWNFEPITTALPTSKPVSDINKKETLDDYGDQSLKEDINSFLFTLNSESLPSLGINYELDTPMEIPSSFTIVDEDRITIKDTTAATLPEDASTSNPAAQFLTSLSFYEFGERESLIPQNNKNFMQTKNQEELNFQTIHNVSLFSLPNKPHFDDFSSGLGLKDTSSSEDNVVYNTIRHKIIFHKAKEDEKRPERIQVVWGEGMTEKEINNLLNNDLACSIRITPFESGLFNVDIQPNKSFDIKDNYQERYACTKESLPVHIISTVLFYSQLLAYTEKVESDNFFIANKALKDEHVTNFFGKDGRFTSTLPVLKI